MHIKKNTTKLSFRAFNVLKTLKNFQINLFKINVKFSIAFLMYFDSPIQRLKNYLYLIEQPKKPKIIYYNEF